MKGSQEKGERKKRKKRRRKKEIRERNWRLENWVVKQKEKEERTHGRNRGHALVDHLFSPLWHSHSLKLCEIKIQDHLGHFSSTVNFNGKGYDEVIRIGVWFPFWIQSCWAILASLTSLLLFFLFVLQCFMLITILPWYLLLFFCCISYFICGIN